MTESEYAVYATREPHVMVMADEDTILVAGHGGVVPLTFAEARDVAAAITNLLAVHNPEPHRPSGLELLAERYGVDAVSAREEALRLIYNEGKSPYDEPTVERGETS